MAGRRRVGDRSGPRAEGVETRERRGAGFFHPPVRGLPMTFDPITAILNIGGKVIDQVWPDPTEAATAKVRMMEQAQAGELERSGERGVGNEGGSTCRSRGWP